MDEYKLTIELVPKTAWYTNVRSNVSESEWDRLRKYCYEKANNVCEICGDTSKNQGKNYNLECHEIFEYDDNRKVQKLTRLIGLCNHCHTVKHPGLANMQGRINIVYSQLMKVNGINELQATEYLEDSFEIWKERSQHEWELDISYLDEYKEEINQYEKRLADKKKDAIRKYKEILATRLDLGNKLMETHKVEDDPFILALEKNFTGGELLVRKEEYSKFKTEYEMRERVNRQRALYNEHLKDVGDINNKV